MTQQLLTEFEKLASEAHQFHPGEWKDCKYTFCRERCVMLEEAKGRVTMSTNSETFVGIEREQADLTDERAKRISDHAAWLKICGARLKELSERAALLSSGIDVARVDRALKVIEVAGDPTKRVNGSYDDQQRPNVRPDALAYAKRLLAESPATLQGRYIGVKNYDRFGDQREDHQYGYGPRHGSIVFSIGITSEARKRDLSPDEIEDALYFLHVWPAITKAKQQAEGAQAKCIAS